MKERRKLERRQVERTPKRGGKVERAERKGGRKIDRLNGRKG